MTQYRLPRRRTTARRKVVSMAVPVLAGSDADGADAPTRRRGLDGLPPLAMTLAPTGSQGDAGARGPRAPCARAGIARRGRRQRAVAL